MNLLKGENDVTMAENKDREEIHSDNTLGDQDLSDFDDNTEQMSNDDAWDNFDRELQEMNGDDFDDNSEELLNDQLHENHDEHRNKLSALSDEDVSEDESEMEDGEYKGRLNNVNMMTNGEMQKSISNQLADILDQDVKETSLDDKNSQFDFAGTEDDFLQLMKAMDEKEQTDDVLRQFLDLVQTDDADDVGSDEKYLEDGNDDSIRFMSEMEGADNTEDNIRASVGTMESSDTDNEDESYLERLLRFAETLTNEESRDDGNQDKTNQNVDKNGAVAASGSNGNIVQQVTAAGMEGRSPGDQLVHSRGWHSGHKHHKHSHHKKRRHHKHGHHKRRRHHKPGHHKRHIHHKRRPHNIHKILKMLPMRRLIRHLPVRKLVRKFPAKIIRKIRRKGKKLLRHIGHTKYYKRYPSLLKKYYHLRKKYYSLRHKHRKVKHACKKTTHKVIASYCKKIRKKMNDYRRVYSKVRGCHNSKKCKFYEKTTNITRDYYKFMYKLHPTAHMCDKIIERSQK